jgi:hypothetical protein
MVLTGLLGENPVVGEPLADRPQDQLLRQVVDLGDDIASALVRDPLDPFDPVAQELPGPGCRLDGEVDLDRIGGPAGVGEVSVPGRFRPRRP